MPVSAALAARLRAPPEKDPEVDSLLRQIGRGGTSGLHTVGSLLSTPSRLLWGTANALAGGKGGFGNLDPLDATGGIELADFLGNMGVVPKNDPNKWEWGDLGRGALNIAGDPLSYLTPLPLTKAGRAAYDARKLTKGVIPSIRSRERALVGLQVPFAVRPQATYGTGAGVADTLQAGATAIDKTPVVGAAVRGANSVAEPVGRWLRSKFDQPGTMGAQSVLGQQAGGQTFRNVQAGHEELLQRLLAPLQKLKKAGKLDEASARAHREWIETRDPKLFTSFSAAEREALNELVNLPPDMLRRAEAAGVQIGPLSDPAGTSFWYRQATGGKRGYRSARRLGVLQGFTRGTEGVNRLMEDPDIVGLAAQIIAGTSSRVLRGNALKQARGRLAAKIEQKYGKEILPTMAQRTKSGKPVWQKDAAGNIVKDAAGNPVQAQVSRYDELANMLSRKSALNWLGKGMFRNHFLLDAYKAARSQSTRIGKLDALVDVLSKPGAVGTVGEMPVSAIFARVGGKESLLKGANSERVITRILQAQGKKVTPAAIKRFRKMKVAPDLAADLRDKVLAPAVRKPQGPGSKLFSTASNLWKAGVLTHPARIMRDLTSGFVRRGEMGLQGSTGLADKLIRGQAVEGLEQIPAIRDAMRARGVAPTPENAVETYRAMYAARHKASSLYPDENLVTPDAYGGVGSLMNSIPGLTPETPGEFLKETAKLAAGVNPQTGRVEAGRWAPWRVRGVPDAAGVPRTSPEFGVAAAAEKTGNYADTINRMAADIELLKQGVDPAEAARRVNEAFVSYDPKALTREENFVRDFMVPFYSFGKSQAKYVGQELVGNPAGRLAQTIKATDRANPQDATLPEYVQQTTSIPVGTAPDGTRRFITGLGLMHEDPLSFLGGGVQGALAEGISRTNPLVKGPVEWASGESFFQRGPLGGRDLGDMDPTVGRLLSNVGEQLGIREPGQGPVRYPGQSPIEFILGNSPVSRALTTARMLSDPRKEGASGALAKAMAFGSGARMTDISPAAQDAVLRDAATAFGKQLGASEYSSVRFTKKQLEELRQADPDAASLAEAFNKLQNQLASRQKNRKQSQGQKESR
jgi:hypothetical protein